jgi:murein hydrolase activator
MKLRALPGFVTLLAFLSAALPVSTQSQPNAQPSAGDAPPEAQLAALNESIAGIENWLQRSRQQRSREEAALSELAGGIAQAQISIQHNRNTLGDLAQQQTQLQEQEGALLEQTREQREIVARALRASYMSGADEPLKLLLTQREPGIAQRMLVYFDAFNRDRLQQIQQWRDTLASLEGTRGELLDNRSALELTNRQLEEQIAELEARQNQRQQLITRLSAEMLARSGELDQLMQNRAHLQELIDEINRLIVDIPAPEEMMPFTDYSGRMPWPLNGDLRARYGETYSGGNLQRQGIIIGAEAGSPVRAIHNGRVVFADWLRGSGNLVVIDHGHNHISLYAHNQSLLKQSGDWVNRGEVLALSGADAGGGIPGLYFEIRRNSQTLNPVEWLEAAR